MSDLADEPDSNSSAQAIGSWLAVQAAVDWSAAGLPRFEDWDVALVAIARLLACSTSPMAMLVGEKGVLIANDSAQELFAETTGAVNGRSVLEALPDSAAFYSSVLEAVLKGRALRFCKQPIKIKRHGQFVTRWFDLDFTPITSANGDVLAVLGIAFEVTTFVHRVRSLSEAEQRLRLALDGSGMVGVWTLDVASRTTVADASVARTYGLPVTACEAGIADDQFMAAIHPEDRQRVSDALSQAIETGAVYRCKYRVKAAAGPTRWVITSAKPAFDEAGDVSRLLGVIIDVTDQMETASALAESRFQFQTLTETLPQIVWSCDAEGRHDYFSTRWSEFTGIQPEETSEDTWKALVYPEHWPIVTEVWEHARSTGAPYDIDYRFRHRSGAYRWLRVMALPIRDERGRITRWFGTSTDIHETYLINEERERLAREFERIATEDHLTGVLTRRAFLERTSKLEDGQPRSQRQTSVLMLDIDHFKSINDTYGHPAGDQVLSETAAMIKASVRKQDIVGRLGGEEFAVFLPRCARDEAISVAERIRKSVESRIVSFNDRSLRATVSIGATSASPKCIHLERLLTTADKALYEAKTSGRNRTVFAATAL
ncbi:diguanylate cyclase (GGDEF)-like protein/PAS domain S-box-containing protein [Methylopila capsulata]|uniref:Diguanylate cyclase (GGDEF)-like protein/PAS domain S-box-containing protein n=1 Tax=Methylopila capsulata TaxID=61654 RepID=A0A9W6MQ33_9HYPH|nr:sensor domain-containing diguanylate cyclase [Methylopila capsulata]MBM7851193.1 diguanylate cyclase (GGDEF)-like protein/PAS domain S-box-containing protein [Methylopila capsulata]GLK54250.1 hypothetical protein GCM10008170_02690 [Methylopila capsulata]